MSRGPDTWKVRLGGRFEVESGNLKLGPPPSKSVGVLFLKLLLRGESWTSRAECCERLFPSAEIPSARNALRQVVFRLRAWLGEDALECDSDALRLRQGTFRVESSCALHSGEPSSLIAPGFGHPWLDEGGRSEEPTLSHLGNAKVKAIPSAVTAFETAVIEASRLDADAARALLIGGSAMFDALPPPRAFAVLTMTEPADKHDSFAIEHLELKGRLYYQGTAMDAAISTFQSAHRLAVRKSDAQAAVRTEAMLVFSMLESGKMSAASAALADLVNADGRFRSFRILRQAAIVEQHWNSDRLFEARSALKAMGPLVEGSNRAERLRYFCNCAALAAESGDVEGSQEATERAESLIKVGFDRWPALVLGLSEGIRLLALGRPAEAAETLEIVAENAKSEGFALRSLYAQEAAAEALSRSGDLRRASLVWRSVERARKAAGMKPTPRLLAQKRRVLAA